jgi:hypothetical protein
LGVMVLVLALPLAIFGIYEIYTVWGMTAAEPLSLFSSSSPSGDDDVATQAPAVDADGQPVGENGPRDVLVARIIGGLCLLVALGGALGARKLINAKRFYVVARGPRRLLRMEVKDEIQQTQVMVTISAVKGKAS